MEHIKGYIKSNLFKYIDDMINKDEYPSDRIFVFNNYTSDSIAIIMTMPGTTWFIKGSDDVLTFLTDFALEIILNHILN